MLVTPSPIVAETRLTQPANACSWTAVTVLGITMDSNDSHCAKAPLRMVSSPSLSMTDFRLEHLMNAKCPIMRTDVGTLMDVSPLHPWKA